MNDTCHGPNSAENFEQWRAYEQLYGPEDYRIKSVVFTDCANAYSSVTSISAPSREKSERLLLAHIRDNMITNLLSYCDARFNIADTGAEIKSKAVSIWRFLLSAGEFRVSFLGMQGSRKIPPHEEE